jgi:hypothetical protein
VQKGKGKEKQEEEKELEIPAKQTSAATKRSPHVQQRKGKSSQPALEVPSEPEEEEEPPAEAPKPATGKKGKAPVNAAETVETKTSSSSSPVPMEVAAPVEAEPSTEETTTTGSSVPLPALSLPSASEEFSSSMSLVNPEATKSGDVTDTPSGVASEAPDMDNDDLNDDEGSSPRDKRKPGEGDSSRRKRRKGSELFDLQQQLKEVQQQELRHLQSMGSLDADDQDMEALISQSPRYQSSRAAAQVAKVKIAGKGKVTEDDLPTITQTGASSNKSKDDETPTPTVSKDKKPSKPAKAPSSKSRSSGSSSTATTAATAAAADWVQCDKCTKWRKLPLNVSAASLPDEWYCSLNIWDPVHNDCAVEEETADSASTEPVAYTIGSTGSAATITATDSSDAAAVVEDNTNAEDADAEDNNEGGESKLKTPAAKRPPARRPPSGAKSGGGSAQSANRRSNVKDTDYDSDDNAAPNTADVVKSTSRRSSTKRSGGSAVVENVDWVQCNRCGKWRRVPGSIKVSDLPDVWECRMNTWHLQLARCSAKEETDGDVVGVSINSATPPPGRGGGGGGRDRDRDRARRAVVIADGPTTTATGEVTKKITQWVQCERRNCKKWRKIPGNIDLNTLPEKWFCEMNKWDPDRASCDQAEETDSDSEQKAHSGRSQLILANSKGPGQLSYRRIIFGLDGRIRAGYSEKNKNGFGIFSYTESMKRAQDDEYIEPVRKLSYWWSNAYRQDQSSSKEGATHTKAPVVPSNSNPVAAMMLLQEAEASIDQSVYENLHPQNSYVIGVLHRMNQQQSKLDDGAAASATSSSVSKAQVSDSMDVDGEPSSGAGASTSRTVDSLESFAAFSHTPLHLRRQLAKNTAKLIEIPLLERLRLESVVVRTVLSAASSNSRNAPTPRSSSGLTLSGLLEQVTDASFPCERMEACRKGITLVALREIVRRLELQGEVDVTLNTQGEVAVQLSQYLPLGKKETVNPLNGTAYSKAGLPLKLRKLGTASSTTSSFGAASGSNATSSRR